VEAIEFIVPLSTNWTANTGRISETYFASRFIHAIALLSQ